MSSEIVITLVTNPKTLGLNERHINPVFAKIERKGGAVKEFNWLAVDEACDIEVMAELDTVQALFPAVLRDQPIDAVVQYKKHRDKRLLISDMDSTMIGQECIDEIADCLGLKEKVSEITERAMNGELDFAQALEQRVHLLAGLNASKLEEVYDKQISLNEGAQTLVKTMANNGALCVLVSGGFTFFTEKIASSCGFAEHYANVLDIGEDATLSGNVHYPILDKESKRNTLRECCDRLGIGSEQVLAIGDGANDLPMLQAAGLGVAYRAKEAVKQMVPTHLDYTPLTTLLFAQGLTKEDWIQ